MHSSPGSCAFAQAPVGQASLEGQDGTVRVGQAVREGLESQEGDHLDHSPSEAPARVRNPEVALLRGAVARDLRASWDDHLDDSLDLEDPERHRGLEDRRDPVNRQGFRGVRVDRVGKDHGGCRQYLVESWARARARRGWEGHKEIWGRTIPSERRGLECSSLGAYWAAHWDLVDGDLAAGR